MSRSTDPLVLPHQDAAAMPANPEGVEGDPQRGSAPLSFRRWSRGALVAGLTIATAAFGAGAALSFETLCVSLTARPVPRGDFPPLANPPEPSRDSVALRSAEQLMGRGNWKGAVLIIDTISPEEPAYPLARELRAEAERLGAGEAVP